jgi:hypothetical protein
MRKAVDWLISEGRIKQDKDLQDIFGYSKSTISAYLTGRPGKKFVNEFQKKFGINLKEFEENQDSLNIEVLSKYILETHAMVRVLMVTLLPSNSVASVEQLTNQLLNSKDKEKNKE